MASQQLVIRHVSPKAGSEQIELERLHNMFRIRYRAPSGEEADAAVVVFRLHGKHGVCQLQPQGRVIETQEVVEAIEREEQEEAASGFQNNIGQWELYSPDAEFWGAIHKSAQLMLAGATVTVFTHMVGRTLPNGTHFKTRVFLLVLSTAGLSFSVVGTLQVEGHPL